MHMTKARLPSGFPRGIIVFRLNNRHGRQIRGESAKGNSKMGTERVSVPVFGYIVQSLLYASDRL